MRHFRTALFGFVLGAVLALPLSVWTQPSEISGGAIVIGPLPNAEDVDWSDVRLFRSAASILGIDDNAGGNALTVNVSGTDTLVTTAGDLTFVPSTKVTIDDGGGGQLLQFGDTSTTALLMNVTESATPFMVLSRADGGAADFYHYGRIILDTGESVVLSTAAGAFTLAASGETFNEDLTFDLDTATANVIDVTTSTGVTELRFSGIALHSPKQVEVVTTTKTTTLAESGEVYTNTGDADGSTITLLNDPTIGAYYTFVATAAQTVTIVASAGETIEANGATCGTSVTLGDGDSVTIMAATGGSGAQWHVIANEGATCNA